MHSSLKDQGRKAVLLLNPLSKLTFTKNLQCLISLDDTIFTYGLIYGIMVLGNYPSGLDLVVSLEDCL